MIVKDMYDLIEQFKVPTPPEDFAVYQVGIRLWFMVFNATFNNISVISWWLVSLVEETEVPGENHRPDASHWQTLSHKVVMSTPHHERGSNLQI